jgi:hypothetical protein
MQVDSDFSSYLVFVFDLEPLIMLVLIHELIKKDIACSKKRVLADISSIIYLNDQWFFSRDDIKCDNFVPKRICRIWLFGTLLLSFYLQDDIWVRGATKPRLFKLSCFYNVCSKHTPNHNAIRVNLFSSLDLLELGKYFLSFFGIFINHFL